MFKFLFGSKSDAPEVKRETQRETVTRALREVNEIMADLDPKPRITIYPEEGTLSIELPEQMPDEAKALPAPEAKPKAPEAPSAPQASEKPSASAA
ncbi:MAG: hypothetical protein JJU09_10425 [Rhodobacteraceae bacterium]|nr:hypothetical protein [Paracoccaceae bacterium]TVR48947.1 MAG: hypothetical protein EA386_03320 [Paracoccaceae bacterium]